MLAKIKGIAQTAVTVILIITVLRVTGLFSAASETVQNAALRTGLMDAKIAPSAAADEKSETFDYGFTVQDMTGKDVKMESFRGKVIFLNMWATWCGPCRAEMPTIQKLFNNVPKENIVFVMLSIDYPQDVSKIQPFIQKKAYTFPVYHQDMKSLPKQLQLPSIPATFVISKDGKILSKEIGMTNFDTPEFKALLESEAGK